MPQEDSSRIKGRFGLSLTFTSLFTIIVVMLGAVSAAYVFGVMQGRKAAAPAMEQPAGKAGRAEVPEAPGPEKILRAQDLEYARALRGEDRRQPPEKPVQPQAASAPQPESASQAALEAQGQTGAARHSLVESLPDGQFDYVFQMAAFRDGQGADQLRERLEGHGLRTRLERAGSLFLVLVPMRGDARRVQELLEIAASLKLGEPLLRSRRPISP